MKSSDAVILETVINAYEIKISGLKEAMYNRLSEWENLSNKDSLDDEEFVLWEDYDQKTGEDVVCYLKTGCPDIWRTIPFSDGYSYDSYPYNLIENKILITLAKRLKTPIKSITEKLRKQMATIDSLINKN